MSRWLLAFLLLLSGCASPKQAPVQDDSPKHIPASTVSTADILAENLKIPWDITTSGGSFFISERKGTIVRIHRDGEKKEMEVRLAQSVLREGEGGLLGFELDPSFSKNGLAYVYHTYLAEDRIANRIVQIQKQNDTWQETKELLANIPGGSIHNGGRLAIGPDKKLYATAGDTGQKSSAQDKQTLSGKILRLNLDGSIPPDNPFKNSYVFSYGHRNPQGMAWSEEGTMYATEHGQSAHDEVNKIEPGKNYGWPIIEGDEQKEGMEPPLIHSGEETWAPSGLAYTNGKLFIAALRGEKLLAFDLKNKKMTVPFKSAGRLRDVYVHSGSLYVVTNNTDGRGTPAKHDDLLLRLSLLKEEN